MEDHRLFMDKVALSMTYCVPPPGNFGLPGNSGNTVLSWDHCREQFAVKFTNSTGSIFYSHDEDAGPSVAAFIRKFESVLFMDDPGATCTRYALTSFNKVLRCDPARFWLDCYFKRSLFTLLLRCGLNYNKERDNFDDALFGSQYKENQYVRDTRPAVMRFMFGFTRFTGQIPQMTGTTVVKHGWKEEFEKLGLQEIRKRLLRPLDSRIDPNVVGADTVWM